MGNVNGGSINKKKVIQKYGGAIIEIEQSQRNTGTDQDVIKLSNGQKTTTRNSSGLLSEIRKINQRIKDYEDPLQFDIGRLLSILGTATELDLLDLLQIFGIRHRENMIINQLNQHRFKDIFMGILMTIPSDTEFTIERLRMIVINILNEIFMPEFEIKISDKMKAPLKAAAGV